MDNYQKTTLVLLPGLDGTGKLFGPFLAALPADICTMVIAYPTDQRLSVGELAEFVASRLPSGRVVLLAEFFYGLVALALLAFGVEWIETVVFYASFAEPPRPKLLRLANLVPGAALFLPIAPVWLLRRYCLGKKATAEQLSSLRSSLSDVSSEVLNHRLRIVANEQSIAGKRFNTPCFYFQAKGDRLVTSNMVDWFEQHFERFRRIEVDGPHFLLQACPEECAQWIQKIQFHMITGERT